MDNGGVDEIIMVLEIRRHQFKAISLFEKDTHKDYRRKEQFNMVSMSDNSYLLST